MPRTKLGSVLGKPVRTDGPFWVDLDKQSDRANFLLASQWGERAEALSKMAPYLAAETTLMGMMGRIPKGPAWAEYRNALRVVRVGPRKWSAAVHAVYGKPKGKADRVVDASSTALYIRPKKHRATPAPPQIHVLAKYSPWTMSTLPFSPKPSEAVVVLRKVSKREMEEVAKKREADRPQWQAELNKTGVRYSAKPKASSDLKGKTVSDLAFMALRLEFGYGGTRAFPHWRPSIKEAARYVRRVMTHRNPLTSVMLKLNNRRWRRWPPKVESSIRIAELKNLKKFQKRLRIRV